MFLNLVGSVGFERVSEAGSFDLLRLDHRAVRQFLATVLQSRGISWVSGRTSGIRAAVPAELLSLGATEAFVEVGGFDEANETAEDLDLTVRLAHAQWPLRFERRVSRHSAGCPFARPACRPRLDPWRLVNHGVTQASGRIPNRCVGNFSVNPCPRFTACRGLLPRQDLPGLSAFTNGLSSVRDSDLFLSTCLVSRSSIPTRVTEKYAENGLKAVTSANGRTVAIILHHGQPSDTANAIRSILKSTVPVEVIVVNNGRPNDVEAIEDLVRCPEKLNLVGAGINLGFAAGVNLGIGKALAPDIGQVFLLNNDAIVEPKTLEHLISVAESRSDFGILAPIVLFADQPGMPSLVRRTSTEARYPLDRPCTGLGVEERLGRRRRRRHWRCDVGHPSDDRSSRAF